ncbi:hypothetical protein BGX21_006174, partial [Mortierella sp. AD011]
MSSQLKLWCIVDGKSAAFSVDYDSNENIDDLKQRIKPGLNPISRGDLTLWKARIPNRDRKQPISLGNIPDKEELDEKATLSELDLTDNDTYVIFEDPDKQ